MNVIALAEVNARLSLFVVKFKLKNRRLISLEVRTMICPCKKDVKSQFCLFIYLRNAVWEKS
jgi:hypothetical protein